MPMKVDNRKDILLLLLYSPGITDDVNEPIIGRTRITKQLFLFKKEVLKHFKRGTAIDKDNFYEFFAWNFGPFSREVYDDLAFFKLRDFIEDSESGEEILPESVEEWTEWLKMTGSVIDDEDVISEYHEEVYKLTEKGCKFAAQLYETLSQEQKTLLKEFKERTQRVRLRALLKYVYENYEEVIGKSTIAERVLG